LVRRGSRIEETPIAEPEIDDVLRPEAVEAMTRMHLGVTVILLTGDHSRIAERVARQLGVQDFAGELLPYQKLRRIEELKRGGRRAAMVGDGINDAPALAEATVGIAMGSGTELGGRARAFFCSATICWIALNCWRRPDAAAGLSISTLEERSWWLRWEWLWLPSASSRRARNLAPVRVK
jgi:haloacid dehalogenase-like hydrolase